MHANGLTQVKITDLLQRADHCHCLTNRKVIGSVNARKKAFDIKIVFSFNEETALCSCLF
jgi:hypothetical protein